MRLLRSLLLIVWCAVAMLGHSGIHRLAELSGACCSADHASGQHCSSHHGQDVDHHGHAHAHGHAHGLHHSHSHDDSTAPDDKSESPSHDSDNCRLCDWFLKIGSSFHWVAQIISTEQIAVFSDRSAAREFGDVLPLPLTRGPPATA